MNHDALQNPSIVDNYRAMLGESPVWCFRSQSLIWVDILQHRLLRYWPQRDDRIEIHELPFLCSAALLTTEPEQFLLVTTQGDAVRLSPAKLPPVVLLA